MRPKITIVTPHFPIPQEPYRGRSIYDTVRKLALLADVNVLCPVATYPHIKSLHPRSYAYYAAPLSELSLPGVSIRSFQYRVVPFISRPFNGRLCRQGLLPLLSAAQPHLVLAYWLYPAGLAAVTAAEHLGIPSVAVALGSDLRRIKGKWLRKLTKRTLERASFVLTVSEELRRKAIHLGAHPSRCRAVLNGCDLSVFRPADPTQARTQLGIAPNSEVALFVGRLTALKGVRDLLVAFQQLAITRNNLHLALIGEGTLQNEISAFIQQTGLTQRVRLLGPCTPQQVAQWITVANFVCLPSYSEGCPNTIVEALACGRPVVATNVGGIPELIHDGNGLLVPPGDINALAQAMTSTLEMQWDSIAISTTCQRTWDDVAQDTLSICEEVLSKCKASRPAFSPAYARAQSEVPRSLCGVDQVAATD
jgi:teichuronic acid biosynthesis glycosyltransferase TuaC